MHAYVHTYICTHTQTTPYRQTHNTSYSSLPPPRRSLQFGFVMMATSVVGGAYVHP